MGTASSAQKKKVSSRQRGEEGQPGKTLLLQPGPLCSTARIPKWEKVKELILEALNLSLPTAEAEHIQTRRNWDNSALGDLMLAALTRRVGLQDNSGGCDLFTPLSLILVLFSFSKMNNLSFFSSRKVFLCLKENFSEMP